MKPRVLFVDDQPEVLAALQRALRGHRDRFDMHFAASAAEALALLESTRCDVLITDIRMPGMDGAELLRAVREKHPHMARFVLSGEADQSRVLHSLQHCHQYLAKPCETELLVSVITRALALRQRFASDRLIQLVSQIGTLPCLPGAYNEVVNELRQPEASLRRVAGFIARDVGMTVKLLQLVNSSYFGLARRIDSVEQAVTVLGLGLIKPLVLSSGIFSQFAAPPLRQFSFERLANHGMAVSKLAAKLAASQSKCRQLIDDAATAGMIHDVGQLVLAASLPEEYADVLSLVEQNGIPLEAAEQELLGASHADVGAFLLESWGLPDAIVEAVAYHHAPGYSHSTSLTALTAVHAANVMVSRQTPALPCAPPLDFDVDYLRAAGAGAWCDEEPGALNEGRKEQVTA